MPTRPLAKLGTIIAIASVAIACQRDVGLSSTVSIRAALTSASSTIVFVQVQAEQDGVRQRATLAAGSDTVTLTLTSGIPATITGVVFTFDAARWRSFSSTQSVTPHVGTTDVELTLLEEPPVSGSLVPVVTVHGAPATLVNEPLILTVHDVDTDFRSETPFSTATSIQVPGGRPVIFSVPDRFSGGSAERSIDTSAFADNTQIELAADVTLGIQGDNLSALLGALGPLAANDLGLQCAVDGDCSSTSFNDCSPATLTLDTERSYQVSVRYSDVSGSCETTRISRDLTPPGFKASWLPPFVQPGLTALTVTIDADEPIDPAGLVLTAGSTSNRCTPAVVSPSQVACAIDLAGLDLSADLLLQTVVTDVAGEQANRVIVIHERDAQPVQVVGFRTIPETPSIFDANALLGVTVAAFDGEPLCGVDDTTLIGFTAPTPTADFQAGGMTWYGPAFVPAAASGPTLVTYWSRAFFSPDAGPLVPGTYAASGALPLLACGGRGAVTPQLAGDVDMIETPIKWIDGGPLVVSSLPSAMMDMFPAWGFQFGGETGNGDTVTASDPNVVLALFEEGTIFEGLQPGTARLTAIPNNRTTTAAQAPAQIDVEVVGPPEILAVQAGRLIRRSRSSDAVTSLPPEIGDGLRVFWESEREDIVVVGSHGVWVQDATGATRTVLDPCAADSVLDASLTASAPAHASSLRDLVVLAQRGAAVHHCELDLTSLATTVDVPISDCTVTRIAGDGLTGRFFAANDSCALVYAVNGGATTTLQLASFVADGPLTRVVADDRAALAVILAGDNVFGFDLIGSFRAEPFNVLRQNGALTFVPTAIAINPMNGVPMLGGLGNDNEANGLGATVFMGYTDRLGQQPAWVQVARTDPAAYTPPTALLFDTASRSFYSSRPGQPRDGIAASMVVLDQQVFDSSPITTDLSDRPIRAWPDGLDIVDMTMAGPQPTNLSAASADVGQRVTITGSGFNGAGRDQVFVQGIAARVVGSTRDSVTFVMPQAFHALTVAFQSQLRLQVAVRSSGMLSGPVPAVYFGDNIELPVHLPGTYIDGFFSSLQACDAVCSPGMTMVDALGFDGTLEVRRPGDNPGVAILDGGSADQDINTGGFFGPIRVPGPRRVVGYSGTSLVDQWPTTFGGFAGQPYAAERSADISQTITAVAASPDGRLLAVADSAGIAFRWASTFAPHPAGRVATAIASNRLAMTSKKLVLAASATGALGAVRFDDVHPTAVTIAADTSGCPSGARSAVLAIATDVPNADVLFVSQYGATLASEAISDDGTNVTQRCLSTGATDQIIAGAIAATTIDRTGARAVILAGSAAYLYDTSDMRLPMAQAATAGTLEGAFLPESGEELIVYDVFAYYLQPLFQP